MYEQIASNNRRSAALVAGFVLLVVALAVVFALSTDWGPVAVPLAIIVATAGAFGSYYYSDSIILAMSSARPVTKEEYPYLFNVVDGLAIAAGIPKPRCYVIDDTAPNAFATGRDPEHAAIVVTEGLIEKLDRLELEGVIAHELSHVKNYDIRLAGITVVLVGIAALLSDWMLRTFLWGGRRRDAGQAGAILGLVGLILAVLTPLVAQMMRMAISRQREYLADASGAMLTRYPEGLANALRKLSADDEPLEAANKATANLYIVNPLIEHDSRMNRLFDTHPPIEERIGRLEELYIPGKGQD